MTKKDFKAIAKIIANSWSDNCTRFELPTILAHRFADYLATRNPRFNREKFLKACEE